MDDLTWTLKQLCRRNRDGSFATQADRQRSLTLMARQLRDAGFNQMQARSLKGKHVDALLNQWQAQGLSTGTLKNRLSHLRWWAEKIGKGGLLPADNRQLGIPERQYSTNQSKAQTLDERLEAIRDAHVQMSLRLQAAFGLRGQECIKFQPTWADGVITSRSKAHGRKAANRAASPSRHRSNAQCSMLPGHWPEPVR